MTIQRMDHAGVGADALAAALAFFAEPGTAAGKVAVDAENRRAAPSPE